MAKRDYYEILGVSEGAPKAEVREALISRIKNGVESKSAPNNLPVKFVAIDGYGGSGKSSLAEQLAKELGAEVIHLDDFASWENPLNWWPLVIEKVFKPIQKGTKSLSYPRAKWWPDHNPETVTNQPATPIMILDGVSSSRHEFAPYLTYKVWVDVPLEICFKRGVERDISQGSPEEIKNKWRAWQDAEKTYVARDNPIINADLIVDGTVDIYG